MSVFSWEILDFFLWKNIIFFYGKMIVFSWIKYEYFFMGKYECFFHGKISFSSFSSLENEYLLVGKYKYFSWENDCFLIGKCFFYGDNSVLWENISIFSWRKWFFSHEKLSIFSWENMGVFLWENEYFPVGKCVYAILFFIFISVIRISGVTSKLNAKNYVLYVIILVAGRT